MTTHHSTHERTFHMEHVVAATVCDRDDLPALVMEDRTFRLSMTLATYYNGRSNRIASLQDQRLRVWLNCSQDELDEARQNLSDVSELWTITRNDMGRFEYEFDPSYVNALVRSSSLPASLARTTVSYNAGNKLRARMKAVLRFGYLAYGHHLSDVEVIGLVRGFIAGRLSDDPAVQCVEKDIASVAVGQGRRALSPTGIPMQRIVTDFKPCEVRTEANLDAAVLSNARLLASSPVLSDLNPDWLNEFEPGATGYALYVLHDPDDDSNDLDEARYVGISDQPSRRLSEHGSTRDEHRGNPAYNAWISGLHRRINADGVGMEPVMTVIERFGTKAAALKAERALVQQLAEQRPGRLLNVEHLKGTDYAGYMHPMNCVEHGVEPVSDSVEAA